MKKLMPIACLCLVFFMFGFVVTDNYLLYIAKRLQTENAELKKSLQNQQELDHLYWQLMGNKCRNTGENK